MRCDVLRKKNDTVIQDVFVRESKEFKDFLEIENDEGKTNLILKSEVETLIEDTEYEGNWVCQVIKF